MGWCSAHDNRHVHTSLLVHAPGPLLFRESGEFQTPWNFPGRRHGGRHWPRVHHRLETCILYPLLSAVYMCVVHSRFNHSPACQLLDSSVKEPIAGVIFSTSLCTQFSSLALLYCKLFTLRSRPLPVQAQPDVCLRGHRRWYRGANFVCERVSRKSKHPEAGKRSEIMRGGGRCNAGRDPQQSPAHIPGASGSVHQRSCISFIFFR